MRQISVLTLTAGCLLACFGGQAGAQSVPRDVQELERAHQLDEDERHPIPEKPAPLVSQQQKLYSTRYPFVCLGTDPWQPVYAKPDYASRISNWLTQSAVAVTGNPINGFLRILYYNGQTAYIPASSVHPYRGTEVPDATCTFAGTDERGRPMFAHSVPQKHQ